MAPRLSLPRIYPITPSKPDARALLRWSAELLDAGCTFLQFRRKGRPDAELLAELDSLVKTASPYAARIVVDDRCDLCILAGAAGVHLGQADLPPREARALLGPAAMVGFSTHGLAQARRGFAEPVDYLALGPVFATGTKENPDPVVAPIVQEEVLRNCPLPVVAIGGITPGRAGVLWARGFASVAVIAAMEEHPAMAWREFARIAEEMPGG